MGFGFFQLKDLTWVKKLDFNQAIEVGDITDDTEDEAESEDCNELDQMMNV